MTALTFVTMDPSDSEAVIEIADRWIDNSRFAAILDDVMVEPTQLVYSLENGSTVTITLKGLVSVDGEKLGQIMGWPLR